MILEPGTKIGDYEILSQLGAGGMGRVYKVKNELSDRVEAMKVLLPDLEGQAELANRFLREIKVQGGLDHPNIAKLYTAQRVDNQLLMFMEFVDGMTLDQRLHQGPIPMADALNYMVQVLGALEYAHQRGVVHRDIKPANMMLLPDGRVKLLDFGIAKASMDSRLTMTGTTLGSLYYMAPEQIQGGQVDLRSDLYSVGVSLYELVTGKKPFEGESQFAIMSAHLARPPVAPVQVKADVPESLSEIILLSLSKDPAARFQSAGAFLNALSNVRPETLGAPLQSFAPATASQNLAGGTAPSLPPPPPPPSMDSLASMTAYAASPPPPPAAQAQPQPPPESFRLIDPTDVAVKKAGPRRFVWAAVGSLCAVAAIVAFIQFGPRGKTSAKETAPPVARTTPPVPVEPRSPIEAAPPKAQETPLPDISPSPAAASISKPNQPQTSAETRKPPIQRAPVQRSQNQVPQSQPGVQPAPQPRPAEPQPQAPAPRSEPAPPAAYGQPERTSLPAAVNKNRMDVTTLGDQLDMMVVRANAIRVSLNDLKRSQNAMGMSLRGDWVEAFNSMNNYLRKANQAINDADAEGARGNMAKAATQIEFLEKALGR